MKVYHGSRNKHDTLKLGGGNNELGSGLYFIASLKVAKGYGSNIVSLNMEDFKTVTFESKTPSKLVNKLIKNSNDEYWWTNWSENYSQAVQDFKNSLTGVFGEDIQTLWYDLYSDDEERFCKIVSEFVDAMYVNQEHGWKNMYVIYNLPKANKLMKFEEIKESSFNKSYERTISKFNEKKIGADQWEPFRKDIPNLDDMLASLGLGPKYKPKPVKKYVCPKCGIKEAYYKEIHADTSMNDVVLYCPECKHRGDD